MLDTDTPLTLWELSVAEQRYRGSAGGRRWVPVTARLGES